MIHYMGPGGHLVVRGFLDHVAGGYELSGPSERDDQITIELSVENEFLIGEVSAAISQILTPFKGVVTCRRAASTKTRIETRINMDYQSQLD